jgi:patatin-like phospholipase/acyl hydrolase
MPVRILSIDGGGTRGLFPATMITQLEQDYAKPVTEIFDVIIGSATGGIIATALAAGLKGHQIRDIYLNEAGSLLPKNFWRQSKLTNLLNLFRAKYSNQGLYGALKKHIGDTKTLGDVYQAYGQKPVFLMPALDLNPYLQADDIPGFKPIVFNSCRKTDHPEKLIDIAMRTSAAAVNLPIYQEFGEGGNYANDPCVFGLSFALNGKPDLANEWLLQNQKSGLHQAPQEIKLLSLGCGSTGASFVPEHHLKNPDWGLLKWQRYLISLVIDSNMVANQYLTQEILPKENYLRINVYYKDPAAPLILRDRKLKIDVTDKEQLSAIKTYAEVTYTKQRQQILNFLQ